MNAIRAFLRWVSCAIVRELPLLVFLSIFAIVPIWFSSPEPAQYPAFPLVMTHILPQALAVAIPLCLVASLRRLVWYVVYALGCLLFFGELLCLFLQHSRILSSIAIVVRQTNAAESAEYLGTAWPGIFTATGCMVAVVAITLLADKMWRKSLSKRLTDVISRYPNLGVIMGIFVLVALVFGVCKVNHEVKTHEKYWTRVPYALTTTSAPVVYGFVIDDTFFGVYQKRITDLEKAMADIQADTSVAKDSLTIIYVIGETFGRHRSSLYGYPLETNPRLSELKADSSLITFDNVVAYSNRTLELLMPLLSLYDVECPESAGKVPLFPGVLRGAGYGVGYYDNQSPIMDAGKFDFGCTYFMGSPVLRKAFADGYSKSIEQYDGDFIARYPVPHDRSRTLAVYHLMGQHVAFDKRSTPESRRFTAASYDTIYPFEPNQAAVMADYDNATRYNDSILNDLIESVRNHCSAVIYVPDHGDEVYDYRDHTGRVLDCTEPGTIKVVHEVPAMIWLSDEYRRRYPGDVEALRKNIHKPLYNTDISHTILDLAGVGSPYFRPDLSLLREGGGRHDRVILGTFRYDRRRAEVDSVKLRYERARLRD